MEQNFQTSFIPKKPIMEERVRGAQSIGLFAVLSALVLFTVLIATGGLYFYKAILTKNITQMENDLHLAQNRLESAKIAELQALDRRLNASNEILSHHIAISPIFKVLQAITMKTVRFTRFDYTLRAEQNQNVAIKLKGVAIGYRSVALQSDLFSKNEHLIDPVFSNLALNDKGEVTFDLDFSVDPNFVDYKQNLQAGNVVPAP